MKYSVLPIFLSISSLGLGNSIYNISVNTSGLSGVSGDLAFDFTSGGGASINTVTITDFASNGTLGTTDNTGLVTGTLPGTVILSEDPLTSFFNEYLTGFTFGISISFQLSATTNAPGPGASPDEFAFFFLDSSGINSLVTTSDPTDADSLVLLDLDGSSTGVPATFNVSNLTNVNAAATPLTVSTPETHSLLLLVAELAGIIGGRHFVQRRSRRSA